MLVPSWEGARGDELGAHLSPLFLLFLSAESFVHRFAAFTPHPLFSTTHPYLLSVLEDHTHPSIPTVANSLVLIHEPSGTITPLAEGRDFYSSPQWSEDGKRVCWIEWEHPDMPWEASRLCVGTLEGVEGSKDGKGVKLAGEREVAGGRVGEEGTAVSQPRWVGEDVFFVWDKSGYSLLYKWTEGGEAELAMDEIKYDIADPGQCPL